MSVSAKEGGSLMAARTGGEAVKHGPPIIPGAQAHLGRLPALRLFVALVFLIPGGLLVLAGLACLSPWLRRLSAVLDRAVDPQRLPPGVVSSRQPDGTETREPSEQVTRQSGRWLEGDPLKWGES